MEEEAEVGGGWSWLSAYGQPQSAGGRATLSCHSVSDCIRATVPQHQTVKMELFWERRDGTRRDETHKYVIILQGRGGIIRVAVERKAKEEKKKVY